MYDADGLWIFPLVFLVGVIVFLLVYASTNDNSVDKWTKQYNGCYVHTTGQTDHETKTLYCPSDVKVQ